jgi:hypothetical protein
MTQVVRMVRSIKLGGDGGGENGGEPGGDPEGPGRPVD